MITILSKIFVKNKTEIEARKTYGTLCSIVGIFLNICLFAGKYLAGVISGSVAITADAFNNLSDAGASFITLVGFLFAGKKPNTEHPFGHGRFEYISGFMVAMAIILMGFELMKTSVGKILHPEAVDTSVLAIAILVVSILVKVYMAFYNKSIGKKINSKAMEATATDSLSDTVATTVVLIAMLVMRFAEVNIDGICGLLVSLFILYAGINAAKETLDPLLGSAPDAELVEEIEKIVKSHKYVVGIHDMVIHDYGPGRFMVSLHVEVPGNEDIYELHDEIDCIEAALKKELSCEAVIHMDPIEMDNDEVVKMRKMVADKMKEIDEGITIHDFRMVTGPTHTNVIFDAVLPFEVEMEDDEAVEKIKNAVAELDAHYFAIVKIDRPYVEQ